VSPDEEQRLVKAAPRDSVAFRQLYNVYFPLVYAYASYRVESAHDGTRLRLARRVELFYKVLPLHPRTTCGQWATAQRRHHRSSLAEPVRT
jgi:hypothetical protein